MTKVKYYFLLIKQMARRTIKIIDSLNLVVIVVMLLKVTQSHVTTVYFLKSVQVIFSATCCNK